MNEFQIQLNSLTEIDNSFLNELKLICECFVGNQNEKTFSKFIDFCRPLLSQSSTISTVDGDSRWHQQSFLKLELSIKFVVIVCDAEKQFSNGKFRFFDSVVEFLCQLSSSDNRIQRINATYMLSSILDVLDGVRSNRLSQQFSRANSCAFPSSTNDWRTISSRSSTLTLENDTNNDNNNNDLFQWNNNVTLSIQKAVGNLLRLFSKVDDGLRCQTIHLIGCLWRRNNKQYQSLLFLSLTSQLFQLIADR